MKKTLIWGLRVCFLMCFLMIPLVQPVLGESDSYRIDLEEVSLDGSWKDYNLPVNAYAYCPLYLEENGLLSLKVQTYFDNNHYVYLLDQNLDTVDYDNHFGKGTAAPENFEFVYFLTAGTYYVRVESWNNVSGLFRIMGEFTPAQTNEIEPNSTFEQAQQLMPNGDLIRGFLSTSATVDFWSDPLPEGTQDFADYYVFTVGSGTWKIDVAPMEETDTFFKATLYNSSHEEIHTEYLQETVCIEQELPAGTYYLAIESNGRACGQYTVSLFSDGNGNSLNAYDEEPVTEAMPSQDGDFEDQAQSWIEDADAFPEELRNSYIYSHGDSTYALIQSTGEKPFTWLESIEFCENINGHLAYIESEDEQDFVAALVKQYGVCAWLGGYTTNGSWKWLDREPVMEFYWADGEPNGSGDSLQIYYNGLWDDTYNKNETVTAFICEWEH